MRRRPKFCQCFELCLASVVLLGLLVPFVDESVIVNSLQWFQHSSPNLYSYEILNSSSSTNRHSLASSYLYPYKFLINQSLKCHNHKPFLVLMVLGDSHDVKARDAIRETWGNKSNYGEVDIIMLFLVGLPPVMPGAVQRLLVKESTMYGDIIQQDFLDTYFNLTLKTLMGMEWLTKFCPNANYEMKIDSDVFLSVNYLVHQFLRPDLPAQNNYLTGLVEFTEPIRTKESTFYVPKDLYPGDMYPPYPSGPGYVFSVDMAGKIYKVAQEIRVISVEDAFVGMCLYKLKMSPTHQTINIFHMEKTGYDRCIFHKAIMVHHYQNKDLTKIWSDFWDKQTLGC